MTQVDPQDEVVELCRDLIRFASVNDGTGQGKGEREGEGEGETQKWANPRWTAV